jgi:hypothetical protein
LATLLSAISLLCIFSLIMVSNSASKKNGDAPDVKSKLPVTLFL